MSPEIFRTNLNVSLPGVISCMWDTHTSSSGMFIDMFYIKIFQIQSTAPISNSLLPHEASLLALPATCLATSLSRCIGEKSSCSTALPCSDGLCTSLWSRRAHTELQPGTVPCPLLLTLYQSSEICQVSYTVKKQRLVQYSVLRTEALKTGCF